MNTRRIKWLIVFAVVTFMLAFEFVRHFVWVALLHTWTFYVLSVAAVVVLMDIEMPRSAFCVAPASMSARGTA